MKTLLAVLMTALLTSCGGNPSGSPVAAGIAPAEPGSDAPYYKHLNSYWYEENQQYSLNLSTFGINVVGSAKYWYEADGETCKATINFNGIDEEGLVTLRSFSGDGCSIDVDGTIIDLAYSGTYPGYYNYTLSGTYEKSDTELVITFDNLNKYHGHTQYTHANSDTPVSIIKSFR